MPSDSGKPLSFADVNDPAAIVLTVGVRGAGKSTLVRQKIVEKSFRIVAYDPHREYGPHTETGERIDGIYHVSMAQFKVECQKGLPESFILRVDPGHLEDEDACYESVKEFVAICEAGVRNAVILFEEPGIMEGMKRPQQKLNYMATQSRHWKCPLVFVCQRAKQVPTTLRSQSQTVVSFTQSSDDDVTELKKKFGKRKVNAGKADMIPDLEKHHYIVWRMWER